VLKHVPILLWWRDELVARVRHPPTISVSFSHPLVSIQHPPTILNVCTSVHSSSDQQTRLPPAGKPPANHVTARHEHVRIPLQHTLPTLLSVMSGYERDPFSNARITMVGKATSILCLRDVLFSPLRLSAWQRTPNFLQPEMGFVAVITRSPAASERIPHYLPIPATRLVVSHRP
jgi:hypothetical protein